MSLNGKIVRQLEIKFHGDLFHEIFTKRPHDISDMSPVHIQRVGVLEGEPGTVGSIIFWDYTDHDGKQRTAKEVVEAIDEEKKTLTLKVIEGDLLDHYETFAFIYHVDTEGDNHLVTWTLEYKKLSEDIEEPEWMMDICVTVTKDIEKHHL